LGCRWCRLLQSDSGFSEPNPDRRSRLLTDTLHLEAGRQVAESILAEAARAEGVIARCSQLAQRSSSCTRVLSINLIVSTRSCAPAMCAQWYKNLWPLWLHVV
jgi:hypothetical protein